MEPLRPPLNSNGIKFYVDNTGNNNQLVKAVLRRRSWFVPCNEIEQAQIIWTQWKKSKIVENLKPHQLYNRIEGNHLLTNKYYLLSSMRDFYDRQGAGTCYLDVMPLTFRLTVEPKGRLTVNPGYQSFRDAFEQSKG
jgi:hypothetical protein